MSYLTMPLVNPLELEFEGARTHSSLDISLLVVFPLATVGLPLSARLVALSIYYLPQKLHRTAAHLVLHTLIIITNIEIPTELSSWCGGNN